jgi:hypothetical protein
MARSGVLGQPITDDEQIVRHEFADPFSRGVVVNVAVSAGLFAQLA